MDQNVWHSGDIPKRCFLSKTLILKKNQQTTKHCEHDKLLIRQSVNEFKEKQHILFSDREVLEKYMQFNEVRCYVRAIR